jgi:HAD superfamily hydrolase (TIGR01509 family)
MSGSGRRYRTAPHTRGGEATAPVELVIFDCDGVLVDSENISNRVLAELLGEHGIALSTAQARAAFQGMRLDEVLAAAEAMLGRTLPQDWLDRYEQVRAAAFDSELEPVPEALETVRSLVESGLAVCVASQGKLSKTERSLALTGLAPLFPPHTRFSAHSVPRGKPAPDLFLAAAAEIGAPPARCLVVEDSPSGVLAASRAQMRAIGYTADADAKALLDAGAELTIERLEELPPLLGLR